jgi:hypothetical protein
MKTASGGNVTRKALRIKELGDLYTPPSIVRIDKSRKLGWTRCVAQMEGVDFV